MRTPLVGRPRLGLTLGSLNVTLLDRREESISKKHHTGRAPLGLGIGLRVKELSQLVTLLELAAEIA